MLRISCHPFSHGPLQSLTISHSLATHTHLMSPLHRLSTRYFKTLKTFQQHPLHLGQTKRHSHCLLGSGTPPVPTPPPSSRSSFHYCCQSHHSTKIPLSNTTPILLPNAITSSLPLDILSASDTIKSFLLQKTLTPTGILRTTTQASFHHINHQLPVIFVFPSLAISLNFGAHFTNN